MQAGFKRFQWGYFFGLEFFPDIGFVYDLSKIGHIVHELRKDRGSKIPVILISEFRKIDPWKSLRHVEPAIGGQAFQKYFREALLLRLAAGRNVEHYSSSSSRMRVTLPTTVGSFSIFAIAALTFFS